MENQTRCLFIDDFHISEIVGLKRIFNQVEKHPLNPLIKPNHPWESNGTLWASNSTIYDSEQSAFKIWYNVLGGSTGYAISPDGINWEKPILGIVEFDGSGNNNMLSSKVFQIIYGNDHFGNLPQCQLFRGLSWNAEKGQHLLHSPDGIKWTNFEPIKINAGDTATYTKTTNSLYGPHNEQLPGYPLFEGMPRYLGVVRWCMPVGQFDGSTQLKPLRRVQVLYKSSDLIHWIEPTRILTPDDLDDNMAQERIAAALSDGSLTTDLKDDRRCEFYKILVFPYEDMYLGLLVVLDASYEFKRMGGSNQSGTGEVQLIATRDLVHWQRLGERRPFIPRGSFGQFDWAASWYCSLPILKDNKLWFFYTGSCITHAGQQDRETYNKRLEQIKSGELPAISSIGLATLRRDGFVFLEAGNETGYVLTKPFIWSQNSNLHFNADARNGEIFVSICQPDGTVYAGYKLSEKLTGDHLDTIAKWPKKHAKEMRVAHIHGTTEEAGIKPHPDFENHNKLEPGKVVRLKIIAKNAKLYSYWFAAK